MLKEGATTLCWPNWTNRSTLSGGQWSTEFPRSHLSDPILAKTSRTSSLSLADTQVNMVINMARPVGVVALANHNISATGRWRIRAYFDSAGTDLANDSGWMDVWPAVYSTQELEWEYNNFWLGSFSDEDRDNFTPLATHFYKNEVIVVRSIRIEIDDQSNSAGYISIGRLFVANAWQPVRSAQYGISYGFSIGTTFETADDFNMTEYADPKAAKRTVDFTLATLNEEEGFRRALALQRDQGIHKEVLYTENPTPSVEGFQKTFIGRLQNITPLTHPNYRVFTNSISLIEIL